MHGEIGSAYRVYLRSEDRIICRHEFAAPNDAEACRLAALLADATSDLCDAFEVWQGGRVVSCPGMPVRDAVGSAPMDRAARSG